MKLLKYFGITVAVIMVILIALGSYVLLALPDIQPATDITIEQTPERIERGKYLANHVTLCIDCHSQRDWSKYAGPMIVESIGGGGELFDQNLGFPGKFFAKNITPYHLGNWTDGEILRAITTGVNKDGKALFPIMSYHRFGQMDKEDVYSIIAYIRTLPTIEKDIPESEPDFPFNFIINTLPKEASFQVRPSENDILAYGKYIINASGCVDCHSKNEKGAIVPGSEFGGGMEFIQPSGIIRSSNITMDKENGIGSWSSEAFVKRFKSYKDSSYVSPELGPDDINTPMPWMMYADMKEKDLEAIYTYLSSVKTNPNKVVKFEKNK